MPKITLTWDCDTPVDSFEVIRSDTSLAAVADEDLPTPIATGITPIKTYDDTTVVTGNTYYYKVRAKRGSVSAVSEQLVALAGVLWTPVQIATRAWYDLSDESTVTLIDNLISAVADKSGNNLHLSQSTASQRPSYSNTVNGGKVATFDGVNDALNASVALLNTTHSLFIVFKPTIESAAGTLFGQWASGQTGRFILNSNQNSAGSAASGRLNPFNSTATSGADSAGLMADFAISNELTLVESISTTGSENWKVYKNGTLTDSSTITSIYAGVNSAIGANSASQNLNPYDGHVGEIVIVNSALDMSTRQKIEGYLAHKWAIASLLANDHPYKDAPPFIL